MKYILILILFAFACQSPDADKSGIIMSAGEEPIPENMRDSVVFNQWIKKRQNPTGISCIGGYAFRMYLNDRFSNVCAQKSDQYYIMPVEAPSYFKANVPGYATIRIQNTGYTEIKVKLNASAWSGVLQRFQYMDYNINLLNLDCNTTQEAMKVYFTVEGKNVGCPPGATFFKYNAWIQSMTTTPYTGDGTNTVSTYSSSWFNQSNWSPASNCCSTF